MKKVTLFVRRNCGHCRQALAVVEAVRAKHPFELCLLDIDRDLDQSDPRRSRLAINVPVLELDGREAFRHEVDEASFRRMVQGLEGNA